MTRGTVELGDGALAYGIPKGVYSSLSHVWCSPSSCVALKRVLLPYPLPNDLLKSKMTSGIALRGKWQFF